MHLRHQILALAVLPLIVAILTITSFTTWQSATLVRTSIATFEQNMLAAKEAELLHLTDLALSAIAAAYENAGPDDAEAKEEVRRILAALDYGSDGYFFVYDYDGANIVHPRQPFRLGRNWLDLQDPDGDRVIANLIAKARAGGGMHRYKWEKPSTGETAEKLSFAAALDKWRWMVGTGVYLDDVYVQTAAANADLRSNIRRTFLIVILIAVPSVLIVFATSLWITLHQRRMADGKLKQLTQRIIDTQEEERRRIARELHDGISQSLIGVRYALDLAARKPGADGALARGIEALNEAIREVRNLSHQLRPRVLDDLGLAAALQALGSQFTERTGIRTSVDSTATADLKPDASTALYRVAQEALTNIERHSAASVAAIRVWSVGGRVRMTVSDDGVGFADTVRTGDHQGGLGLRNMQERLAHFGGMLLVDTSASGTELTAMLPRSASLHRKRGRARHE